MAWPGVPTGNLPLLSASSSQPMDMKMYELTEQLRSMQIVQAEQSRRLDEQSYRLRQLEMKDLQANRLESQRYLWGPGAVGSTPPKALSGLGFEVFPSAKEKGNEIVATTEEILPPNGIDTADQNVIEADIDNLLLSPISTPKESVTETVVEDPPPRADSQSPALPAPAVVNYFPYILNVQCWLGGRTDRPSPSEADILTAQINTAVHASFIDGALVHHLGLSHRIRTRRPPRHNQSHRFQGSVRPRILVPVYFPIDPTQPASSSESQVAKIQIDFVVVNTHDLTPLDHQKFTPLEIGSQALFLHGIDVLFSTRMIRISGINIPLAQCAPRDQKRLLSSIALPPFVASQQSWDRLRRGPKPDENDTGNETWNEDQSLLRNTSANSSFSSTCVTFQSSTTTLTSPAMTDMDPNSVKEDNVSGLPTPPLTADVFTSALQFIPSSVVAKPAISPDESRLKIDSSLVDPQPKDSPPPQLSDSSSYPTDDSTQLPLDPLDPPSSPIERLRTPPSNLDLQSIPSRKSSLADPALSRKSSLLDPPDDLPPRLLDVRIQRISSSTWPRSLGKKVAPWTSVDATKTSILGTAFDGDGPVAPPRRMKILKPVRSQVPKNEGEEGEVFKVDVVRDVVRVEVKEGDDNAKKEVQPSKNVGGGAFHWMK